MTHLEVNSFILPISVIHIDRRVNLFEHPKSVKLFACHLLNLRLQASGDLKSKAGAALFSASQSPLCKRPAARVFSCACLSGFKHRC